MGIKRFFADKDTTITNAYKSGLNEDLRATGSNMGASDVLETFSIYDQGSRGQYSDASSGSAELSRILINFPVSDISASRNSGSVPASGNVNFYMKMYNTRHAFTLPRDFKLVIAPISQSWDEGYGLDMEQYSDETREGKGANWVNASSASSGIVTWASSSKAVIVINSPSIGDDETFSLQDAKGAVQGFIFKDDVTTVDGTKDGANVIIGINGASADLAIATRIGNAINAAKNLGYIDIEPAVTVTGISSGLGVVLFQQTAGSSGNNDIDLSGVTGVSSVSFAGGRDQGGAYHTSSISTVTFTEGYEDLEVNVTDLMEEWLLGGDNHHLDGKTNYGVGIYFTSSQEAYFSSSTGRMTGSIPHNTVGAKRSYYTKKFFASGSEFFFKRPHIEARWDSSTKDDRGNFYSSSSLAGVLDNLNTVYLYNYVRGQLKDIPTIGKHDPIYLALYTSASGGEQFTTASVYKLKGSGSGGSLQQAVGNEHVITGGWVASGTYSASFAVITTASTVYDRWYSGSAGAGLASLTCYHTGAIDTSQITVSFNNPTPEHMSKITNLKSTYTRNETPKLRLFVREKDWNPNLYTKATSQIKPKIIEDAYYKVYREIDNLTIVDYGTGSANLNYTRMSFDVSGSYFDFDMSLLEKGYSYGFKFVYYINGKYHEQPETFKFRVE